MYVVNGQNTVPMNIADLTMLIFFFPRYRVDNQMLVRSLASHLRLLPAMAMCNETLRQIQVCMANLNHLLC